MYDAIADPYCYKGTTVLRNLPGLRDQRALDEFEKRMTAQRSEEPFPAGRLSIAHYCAIHRHLFQDVYAWAGRYRAVRMSKDGSAFCYPENISREMQRLFTRLRMQRYFRDLSRETFANVGAEFLATLNAIHPFREGNGRTQMAFMALVAHRAGHPLDLERLVPSDFLAAMVTSFKGNDAPLVRHLLFLVDNNRAG